MTQRPWSGDAYIDESARIIDVADHPNAAVRDGMSGNHPGCTILHSKYDYEGEQVVAINDVLYKIRGRLPRYGPEIDYVVSELVGYEVTR